MYILERMLDSVVYKSNKPTSRYQQKLAKHNVELSAQREIHATEACLLACFLRLIFVDSMSCCCCGCLVDVWMDYRVRFIGSTSRCQKHTKLDGRHPARRVPVDQKDMVNKLSRVTFPVVVTTCFLRTTLCKRE